MGMRVKATLRPIQLVLSCQLSQDERLLLRNANVIDALNDPFLVAECKLLRYRIQTPKSTPREHRLPLPSPADCT